MCIIIPNRDQYISFNITLRGSGRKERLKIFRSICRNYIETIRENSKYTAFGVS